MPSKFRNASSKRISFFSFQDIITAVTGILILVTLIMTLYLNKAGGVKPAKTEPPRNDVKGLIQSMSRSNLWLVEQINRAAAAPPLSRLMEIKRELESSLKSSEQNKTKALADHYDGLVKTNLQMQATSEQLEVKLEELTKTLAQKTSETNVLFVIKGLQNSIKTPVIGVVSGSSLSIERIGDPAGGHRLDGANPVSEFAGLTANYNRQKDYFVFLVRPSGIDTFYGCRKAAMETRFDVGVEPIAEDLQFKFDSREGK